MTHVPFLAEHPHRQVTGANTGIGQVGAVAMGATGDHVICSGRSSTAETVAMITDAGGAAESLTLDFADPMVATGPSATRRSTSRSTTPAPSAARMPSISPRPIGDVNLKALSFSRQAFGKAVLACGGHGKVVNIASLLLGFQGGIRVPSYTASKHGVAGLTKLLANEWAAKGINVNAIAPGYISTDNTKALRNDPDQAQAILDRIPAGRWGDSQDIADSAVYPAAPASDYVHGAILNVDGG